MRKTTHTKSATSFQELLKIGSVHAATSLTKLLSKDIQLTPPTIEFLSYDDLYHTHRAEDEQVKAVVMKLYGEHEGVCLFVLGQDQTEKWQNLLLNDQMSRSDELLESAIQEMVNILVHSFLNAVVHVTGLNLLTSVPIVLEDMFGSILSSVYIEQAHIDEQIILINTTYYCEGEHVEGTLYFVPTPETIHVLATSHDN